jgi:glycerophosphoryl diester phosphodiesterase
LRTPSLNAPSWLTARPIAHRGFHDKSKGSIENSPAAAEAAIARHYAIECDVQLSKDGEAIVFHDFSLDRLTTAQGSLSSFTAEELEKTTYREGDGGPVTLASFLKAIAGRTPLIIEIKSRFDGDPRLAQRTAAIVSDYAGPVALKSFDPDVLRTVRAASPVSQLSCPLGFIGEAHYTHAEWSILPATTKAALQDFSFYPEIQPDFLSWSASDLPHAVPRLCRDGIGMPVMVWTIRSPEDRARISRFADQIIFEGFDG